VRSVGGVELQVKVKCTFVEALRLCIGRTVRRGIEVQVKVKCTVVQALRLCIGRTVRRGNRGIGKVKVHRCTGTEVLYRPYSPYGSRRINLLFLDHTLEGMRGQRHTPAAPYLPERPGTNCAGGSVGPRASLDGYRKSRPHRNSIPGPASS